MKLLVVLLCQMQRLLSSVFGFWLHPHTNHKDFFTPRHFWIPHFPHTIIHKLPQICARIISFMDVPMAWPTFNQRHLDGFVRQAARRRADCAHGKPQLQLSTFHEWFSSIFGRKLTRVYYQINSSEFELFSALIGSIHM